MFIKYLSLFLSFFVNILKSITAIAITMMITTSNVITIIPNTDTPATRPVDTVCESLDEEMSDAVELIVDELSIAQ